MVTFVRTPPAAMLEAHARARSERPEPAVAAQVVNVAPALSVATLAPDELPFRGRVFRVPPVPFPAGLRLLGIAARIEAVGAAPDSARGAASMLATLADATREAMELCWSLVRPRWCPRWLWRLRANRFASADLEEVREILGFFGQRRTSSHVRR